MKLKEQTKQFLGALAAAVICCAILGMTFGSRAHGQEAPKQFAGEPVIVPADEVRAVAKEMLGALQEGDAGRAYAATTVRGKKAFENSEGLAKFFAENHPMLVASKAVVIGKPFLHEGELVQPAIVVDAFGKAWLVIMLVELETGGWKVAGMAVSEAPDVRQPL